MPIKNKNHYNPGPIVYLFGHGQVCFQIPPRVINLKQANCISFVNTKDKEEYVVYLESHKQILHHFVAYAATIMAEKSQANPMIDAPLSKYWDQAVNGTIECIRYISPHFEHQNVQEYIIEEKFDIRKLATRLDLLQNGNLSNNNKKIIIEYQNEYMPVTEREGKTWCFEIRERNIHPACNFFWNDQLVDDALPPPESYLKYNCKLILSVDNTSLPLCLSLFFNKHALASNIDMFNKTNNDIVHYEKYCDLLGKQYNCKVGTLSGDHLIFVQFRCSRFPCNDSKKHDSQSNASISHILETFIDNFHLFVRKEYDSIGKQIIEVHEITLLPLNKLGAKEVLHDTNGEFDYYDLAMPADFTLVLSACTGRDTVLESIFGNEMDNLQNEKTTTSPIANADSNEYKSLGEDSLSTFLDNVNC